MSQPRSDRTRRPGAPGRAASSVSAFGIAASGLWALGILGLAGCSGVAGEAGAAASRGAADGTLQVHIEALPAVQSLEAAIADVKFAISGPDIPAGTPVVDVPRSAFQAGAAVAHWDDLLPGPVQIQAQVLDSAGDLLAQASGSATIVTAQTAQMALSVVPDTGSLQISANLSAFTQPASLSLSFGGVPPHSWQEQSPLAIAQIDPSAVLLDGTLFLVGGDFNYEFERYDFVAQTWSAELYPEDSTTETLLGQAGVLGDRIVVVGRDLETIGMPEDASPVFLDPFAQPAILEEPAPAADANLADLQSPRTAVGVASDGQTLYMLGGTSKRNVKGSSAYVYVTLGLLETLSDSTMQWEAKDPMPTPRASLGAALLGGKLYAAGGFQWTGTAATDPVLNQPGITAASAQMTPTSAFEVYDPASDAWTELAPMPTARYGLSLVAASGRLYAIGGTDGSSPALATVESYDPTSGTWRTEPSLPVARSLAGAVALGDQILVAGGVGTDGRALRSVEVYNTEALP